MPYYPADSQDNMAKEYYVTATKGEKLVMDYLNINIFDVQIMPIDIFLFYMREAYIHLLSQTEKGREYLYNCYRMEQTKPDRKSLRKLKKEGDKSGKQEN